MSTKFHSPVLFVKDMKISKDFYIKTLEQEVQYDFGMNVIFKSGLTLWQVRKDHLIKGETRQEVDINNFELYFENEDIESFADKIKKNNILLLHNIHEEPWGQRTIRFFDPDNHLIEVGEPLHIFITRLRDEGMSLNDINLKSGISTHDIRQILNIQSH